MENSDHGAVSVSVDFPSYSCADWDGLRDHFRDVLREDIFKLSASAAASEFCELVQVGIDVYIAHRKYKIKPHSCP